MLKLEKKIKGSTMIESMVAISILTSILFVAFTIIIQSYKNDNLIIKTRSIVELQNKLSELELNKKFINGSKEAGAYMIDYKFENEQDKNTVKLTYEIKLNETTIWKSGEFWFASEN